MNNVKNQITIMADGLCRDFYFGYKDEHYLVGSVHLIEYNKIVVKDNVRKICAFATIDELFAKNKIVPNPNHAPSIEYEINENDNNELSVEFKLRNHNFDGEDEDVTIFTWLIINGEDYFRSNAIDIKYSSTIYLNNSVIVANIDSANNVKSSITYYK